MIDGWMDALGKREKRACLSVPDQRYYPIGVNHGYHPIKCCVVSEKILRSCVNIVNSGLLVVLLRRRMMYVMVCLVLLEDGLFLWGFDAYLGLCVSALPAPPVRIGMNSNRKRIV